MEEMNNTMTANCFAIIFTWVLRRRTNKLTGRGVSDRT
jgi:hypothetical protein